MLTVHVSESFRHTALSQRSLTLCRKSLIYGIAPISFTSVLELGPLCQHLKLSNGSMTSVPTLGQDFMFSYFVYRTSMNGYNVMRVASFEQYTVAYFRI